VSTGALLLHQQGAGHVELLWITEVVAGFRVERPSVLDLAMSGNNATKSSLGTLYRSVDKREFSDVVLVNHSQNRLRRLHMNFWLAVHLLVHRFELSLNSVRRDSVLTNPSSGMSPKVSCLGLRLIAARAFGIPHEFKQLNSASCSRLWIAVIELFKLTILISGLS
jgi:hypothetical protein